MKKDTTTEIREKQTVNKSPQKVDITNKEPKNYSSSTSSPSLTIFKESRPDIYIKFRIKVQHLGFSPLEAFLKETRQRHPTLLTSFFVLPKSSSNTPTLSSSHSYPSTTP